MGDLTTSSHEWWSKLVEEAKGWYLNHQKLGPLERLDHRPLPSMELSAPRWGRLERRATSLLLAALPDPQKEVPWED